MPEQKECEKRRWWFARENGLVVEVEAESREHCHPETWWVPSEGCTMFERHHLFPTAADAARDALDKSNGDLLRLTNRRNRLLAVLNRRSGP